MTTYLLSRALPNAKIVCFDPLKNAFSGKARWRHPGAIYYVGEDFVDLEAADWDALSCAGIKIVQDIPWGASKQLCGDGARTGCLGSALKRPALSSFGRLAQRSFPHRL